MAAADVKLAAVNVKKAAKSPKDAKKAMNANKEVEMALKAAAAFSGLHGVWGDGSPFLNLRNEYLNA